MNCVISRRGVLTAMAMGSTGAALTAAGRAGADPGLVRPGAPDSGVDIAHATPELVAVLESTFQDKSAHDVDRTIAHFSRSQLTYTDSTLGLQFAGWAQLRALFAQLMPAWPASARSYPTRIIGNATSGVVLFTNTPELFGGEIRSISPIDLKAGHIVRQVGLATATGLRVPLADYPVEFGERQTGERAHPTIRSLAAALVDALSAGDVVDAAAFFSPDAVFEDLALHTQFVGRPAITGFLRRALPLLPYGPGTLVRHVVGGVQGGGYEWTSPHGQVRDGVVAIVLDKLARITRLTTTWDGGALDTAALSSLLAATLEQ